MNVHAPSRLFRNARRVCAVGALLLIAVCGSRAFAAEPPQSASPSNAEGALTLNFKDADIRSLISTVSELTGENFVVDPRVQGKVTVISAAPTDPDALYDVFLSILRVHGFTALRSDGVTKIVPEAIGKQEPSTVSRLRTTRGNEEIVTAVIPVYYVTAAELVPILRPLLPQEAHLAATTATNVLIAVDTTANVQRLIELVREVDIDPTHDVEVIALRNASAPDLVQILDTLAGKTQQATNDARGVVVVADERTNSLLITGPANKRLRYRAVIAHLDSPDRETNPTKVVYLRYASAADLAPILQEITADAASAGPRTTGKVKTAVAAAATNSTLKITADESTNALIIQGPQRDVRSVMEIIDQLDVRRAQVLVEGIVAEVSNEKTDELGVQWKTSLPDTGVVAGTLFPGVVTGGIDSPFDPEDQVSFLSGLTLGYLSGGDIRALIRALSGDQYTNVLSTPSLMTLDNAEAEIVVGQNVPFVTGQFTNTATTPDNPFQTIERQDVGILLKVKPQINEGNTVTLDIEQEVSSVDRSTSGADLITNKRAITTSVLVDDGDIVVLGGLISDDLRENEQKIPLLGDIPLIGQLFKTTNSDATKTNLMVFLRPQIVRDKAKSKVLTRSRYEDMRNRQLQQEAEQQDTLLREKGPVMPALDGLVE